MEDVLGWNVKNTLLFSGHTCKVEVPMIFQLGKLPKKWLSNWIDEILPVRVTKLLWWLKTTHSGPNFSFSFFYYYYYFKKNHVKSWHPQNCSFLFKNFCVSANSKTSDVIDFYNKLCCSASCVFSGVSNLRWTWLLLNKIFFVGFPLIVSLSLL